MGAFGCTVKARSRTTNKIFAVKIIAKHSCPDVPDYAQRCVRECSNHQKLSQANIVKLEEWFSDESSICLLSLHFSSVFNLISSSQTSSWNWLGEELCTSTSETEGSLVCTVSHGLPTYVNHLLSIEEEQSKAFTAQILTGVNVSVIFHWLISLQVAEQLVVYS